MVMNFPEKFLRELDNRIDVITDGLTECVTVIGDVRCDGGCDSHEIVCTRKIGCLWDLAIEHHQVELSLTDLFLTVINERLLFHSSLDIGDFQDVWAEFDDADIYSMLGPEGCSVMLFDDDAELFLAFLVSSDFEETVAAWMDVIVPEGRTYFSMGTAEDNPCALTISDGLLVTALGDEDSGGQCVWDAELYHVDTPTVAVGDVDATWSATRKTE